MRGLVRLVFFIALPIAVGVTIDPHNAIARGAGAHGGGGGGFVAKGGGAHFAFRGTVAGMHRGTKGAVSMATRHVPMAGAATARAFMAKHGHGETVLPFGAWDWTWGYTYPEVTITTPIEPATEPAFAPPIPEAQPPCREIQAGVTIIRGKSCRA